MATASSKAELANVILETARRPGSVLFAGAGVGKRSGLPDWQEYIEYLVSVARDFEEETAILMRKRLDGGLFTKAIDLYKACPEIPEGEKLKSCATPFHKDHYRTEPLRALVALPFNSIVTTNFDRSLHDTYATVHGSSPVSAEFGDPSLRQAIFSWKDFYIARIHGRAEVPSTMVLDTNDYLKTEDDPDYTDFLIHILSRKTCLFLGYSFLDPAISRILDVFQARVGPNFPELHVALLPESSNELASCLSRYNIKVLFYDPVSDHSLLWEAVREALNLGKEGRTKPSPVCPRPLESSHRMLAATYARMCQARKVEPLRRVVSEGVLLALISEEGVTTEKKLADLVCKYLPLNVKEATSIVSAGIEVLSSQGWIGNKEEQITLLRPIANKLSAELGILADGVESRLIVAYGKKIGGFEKTVVVKVLEEVILARGWDLGASISSTKRSEEFEVGPVLDVAISQFGDSLGPEIRRLIASASRDLLQRPDQKESEILVRLARLAFGVEMAIERGRATLVHSLTLPQRIYLDANVLMPAITEGHPYRATYISEIKRLQEASQRTDLGTRVLVLDVFLNEIITHRQKALSFVGEAGLDDPERLAKYILLVGANNTNVFIGGYSSFVGREKTGISFRDYLKKVSPYETEGELKEFLERQGIEVIPSIPEVEGERVSYGTIFSELLNAYGEDAQTDFTTSFKMKPTVLIRHEARQLSQLQYELEKGFRSLFITADSRLRRLSVGQVLGPLSNALFSHIGFFQLIDLLVGVEARPESLARLIWAVEARDDAEKLRGYFVDLALRHYDAAMAMTAPKVVDEIVEQVREKAKEEGVALAFPGTGDDVDRTFRFLDRFEESFFGKMADEIRKQQTGGLLRE